jgi:multidrug efflux pump subunit AcrA (membrane-fusion protein)
MTFEVTVEGRTRTVSIDRSDRSGRFRVTLDGEPHLLDLARAGEFGLSILAVPFSGGEGPQKVTVPGSWDVQLIPGSVRGELLVSLRGRTASVAINGRRTGHSADAAVHAHGEVHITAPMPGRVVRLLVAPGDEIAVRQGVVVVEAMKMENELRAPRAGRVKEVSVAPGTSVEAGRVLAIIE